MKRIRFLFPGLILAACGGSTTASGSKDAGHDSSSGGSGGSGGSTGGTAGASGGCAQSCAAQAFKCCGGACVNAFNDIDNCGSCGHQCTGTHPYCNNGTCGTPVCAPDAGSSCSSQQFCCGTSCCGAGQLCCLVPGPAEPGYPICADPTAQGTCPMGCPTCICASPDTSIATPAGDHAIASLCVGDLVYSVNHGRVAVVPIRQVNRVPVSHHFVVRVALASGGVLEISARHPTADGRTFGELRAGETLDGMRIVSAQLVPYQHAATYDILPDSDTGAYFAGGVLIGSTLERGGVRVMAPTAPYSMAP
jgi:Stigma-specific protein, Stig1